MEWKLKKVISNLFAMIYAELPKATATTYKTVHKKHVSIIAPGEILGNEKLMLGLIYTAMAAVLFTWAFRKS